MKQENHVPLKYGPDGQIYSSNRKGDFRHGGNYQEAPASIQTATQNVKDFFNKPINRKEFGTSLHKLGGT